MQKQQVITASAFVSCVFLSMPILAQGPMKPATWEDFGKFCYQPQPDGSCWASLPDYGCDLSCDVTIETYCYEYEGTEYCSTYETSECNSPYEDYVDYIYDAQKKKCLSGFVQLGMDMSLLTDTCNLVDTLCAKISSCEQYCFEVNGDWQCATTAEESSYAATLTFLANGPSCPNGDSHIEDPIYLTDAQYYSAQDEIEDAQDEMNFPLGCCGE